MQKQEKMKPCASLLVHGFLKHLNFVMHGLKTAWKGAIIDKDSTCTVGRPKEPPTDASIRKNRANALLRLLTQPLFAHS